MNSPSDPDLTPSVEKVRLYLDYEDQQIVIGALLLSANSCEFHREAVLEQFPSYDRTATAAVFDRMTDKIQAILARLR